MRVLRITNLPTKDYPASGLVSHYLIKKNIEYYALPFPSKLLKHKYKLLFTSSLFDIRNKNKNKITRILYILIFYFQIYFFINRYKINHVHIHWFPFSLISLFRFKHDVSFYITFHGEDARHILKYPFRHLDKFFKYIFVVGSFWHKKLNYNNIVSKEIFNFSEIKNLSYIKEKFIKEKYTFIFVASEKDHKNIGFLNNISDEVISLLKNGTYKFTFIGMSKNYLKDKLPKLFNYITIFNRLGRNDTLFEIARSHFLVLPSIHEGTPKVVLEASQLSTIPLLSNTIKFKGFNYSNYPFRFSPTNICELDKLFLNITNYSHIDLHKYFKNYNLNDVTNFYYNYYMNDL